jgi:lysophospholipase L1-like esterase
MGASPASAPRTKRWRRRLAAGVLALVAALAIAEVVLRLTISQQLWPAESMHRYYVLAEDGVVPAPDFQGTFTYAGRSVGVRTNRLGMRAGEPPPKAEGARRVLCLGDSVVFGVGVEEGETLAARLQEALLAGGTRAFVASGGGPGLGVFDYARLLRRWRPAFAPDLVVAGVYLGNDFEDNCGERTVFDGYLLAGPVARLVEGSWRMRMALRLRLWYLAEHLLRVHWPSLALQFDVRDPVLELFAGLPLGIAHCIYMDAGDHVEPQRRVWAKMDEALAALRDAAAGVPVLVAILPTPAYLGPEPYARHLQAVGLAPTAHQRGYAQRRIAERCAQLGLRAVDLTPVLAAAPEPSSLFLKDDAHLSPAGHRVVALALAPLALELQR